MKRALCLLLVLSLMAGLLTVFAVPAFAAYEWPTTFGEETDLDWTLRANTGADGKANAKYYEDKGENLSYWLIALCAGCDDAMPAPLASIGSTFDEYATYLYNYFVSNGTEMTYPKAGLDSDAPAMVDQYVQRHLAGLTAAEKESAQAQIDVYNSIVAAVKDLRVAAYNDRVVYHYDLIADIMRDAYKKITDIVGPYTYRFPSTFGDKTDLDWSLHPNTGADGKANLEYYENKGENLRYWLLALYGGCNELLPSPISAEVTTYEQYAQYLQGVLAGAGIELEYPTEGLRSDAPAMVDAFVQEHLSKLTEEQKGQITAELADYNAVLAAIQELRVAAYNDKVVYHYELLADILRAEYSKITAIVGDYVPDDRPIYRDHVLPTEFDGTKITWTSVPKAIADRIFSTTFGSDLTKEQLLYNFLTGIPAAAEKLAGMTGYQVPEDKGVHSDAWAYVKAYGDAYIASLSESKINNKALVEIDYYNFLIEEYNKILEDVLAKGTFYTVWYYMPKILGETIMNLREAVGDVRDPDDYVPPVVDDDPVDVSGLPNPADVDSSKYTATSIESYRIAWNKYYEEDGARVTSRYLKGAFEALTPILDFLPASARYDYVNLEDAEAVALANDRRIAKGTQIDVWRVWRLPMIGDDYSMCKPAQIEKINGFLALYKLAYDSVAGKTRLRVAEFYAYEEFGDKWNNPQSYDTILQYTFWNSFRKELYLEDTYFNTLRENANILALDEDGNPIVDDDGKFVASEEAKLKFEASSLQKAIDALSAAYQRVPVDKLVNPATGEIVDSADYTALYCALSMPIKERLEVVDILKHLSLKFVDGKNIFTFAPDSELTDLVLTVKQDITSFKGVYLNGEKLKKDARGEGPAKGAYKLEEDEAAGTVTITIYKEALEKLAKGKYEIQLDFSDVNAWAVLNLQSNAPIFTDGKSAQEVGNPLTDVFFRINRTPEALTGILVNGTPLTAEDYAAVADGDELVVTILKAFLEKCLESGDVNLDVVFQFGEDELAGEITLPSNGPKFTDGKSVFTFAPNAEITPVSFRIDRLASALTGIRVGDELLAADAYTVEQEGDDCIVTIKAETLEQFKADGTMNLVFEFGNETLKGKVVFQTENPPTADFLLAGFALVALVAVAAVVLKKKFA